MQTFAQQVVLTVVMDGSESQSDGEGEPPSKVLKYLKSDAWMGVDKEWGDLHVETPQTSDPHSLFQPFDPGKVTIGSSPQPSSLATEPTIDEWSQLDVDVELPSTDFPCQTFDPGKINEPAGDVQISIYWNNVEVSGLSLNPDPANNEIVQEEDSNGGVASYVEIPSKYVFDFKLSKTGVKAFWLEKSEKYFHIQRGKEVILSLGKEKFDGKIIVGIVRNSTLPMITTDENKIFDFADPEEVQRNCIFDVKPLDCPNPNIEWKSFSLPRYGDFLGAIIDMNSNKTFSFKSTIDSSHGSNNGKSADCRKSWKLIAFPKYWDDSGNMPDNGINRLSMACQDFIDANNLEMSIQVVAVLRGSSCTKQEDPDPGGSNSNSSRKLTTDEFMDQYHRLVQSYDCDEDMKEILSQSVTEIVTLNRLSNQSSSSNLIANGTQHLSL